MVSVLARDYDLWRRGIEAESAQLTLKEHVSIIGSAQSDSPHHSLDLGVQRARGTSPDRALVREKDLSLWTVAEISHQNIK